jgi:Kef-type K+ transport system membrane component KefB
MLELAFNVTEYGKAILAACFINDLGTVTALGLIFSPLPIRTLIFVVVSVVVFVAPPFLTPRFFKKCAGRVSELEVKYILFFLFGMGGLAVWAGSEAVLPAYMIGMVLAGTVGKDRSLERFQVRYALSGALRGCRSLLVASTRILWFRGAAILEPL